MLKLSSTSGVSFEGVVQVTEAETPLRIRFTCFEGNATVGVSLLDPYVMRASPERRWLACTCEPDLRFFLSEFGELENFDDPELAGILEH